MGGPDGKIFGPRSCCCERGPIVSSPAQSDSVNIHFMIINYYDHGAFPLFLLFFSFSHHKFRYQNVPYVTHFDQKVGIYIATKLFQLASRKESYTYGLVRDFLISFAMKACAGPYRSILIKLLLSIWYDKHKEN